MPKPVDLAAALAAQISSDAEQLTLAELVSAFYAYNPAADGEERLRKWIPAFGHLDAWAVPSEALERAAEALLAGGYAPGSVNRDLGCLGTVYRWAKKRRLCPRGFTSPTLSIRRYAEPIRRVHVTAQELEALRAGSLVSRSRGFAAFVHALIDSGARRSEVLERRWADFDPEASTLIALQTKTDRPRVLFLQPRTVTLIKRLGGPATDPDAFIFRAARYPDQPANFRRPWAKLTADIGRPDLHLHDLRHAVAANLLRSGVTSGVAAQVLGHAPEVLHRRYGHLETAALRQAIERAWEVAA